jgi:hypothetical protein
VGLRAPVAASHRAGQWTSTSTLLENARLSTLWREEGGRGRAREGWARVKTLEISLSRGSPIVHSIYSLNKI